MDLILSIAAIHLLACLSPGPDIFLVVLNSVRHGWKTGVATTVGILSGVSLHIVLGLTGISYLITQGEWIERGVSLAGGAWLVYLGSKGLKSSCKFTARHTAPEPAQGQGGKLDFSEAWRQGFLVNLLNPKAFLFFISLFSVMLGPELPLKVRIGSGVVMIIVQAIAFPTVAFLVDRLRFKSRWFRIQVWLEISISLVLLLIGMSIWLHALASMADL